jgi:hypothetical protein
VHRKRVNISTVLAGQRLGIKEVDDGIWIVSFIHYDLGFIVGFGTGRSVCRGPGKAVSIPWRTACPSQDFRW